MKLLHWLLKMLVPFLIWGVIYLLFSFIAFDFNPMNWLIFQYAIGRIFALFLIVPSIVGTLIYYLEVFFN